MQHDVIDEILSVEENAQKLEKDAQSRSREMVMDAQSKATQYVRDTLNAKHEADRKELEKAEADAQQTIADYTGSLDTAAAIPSADLDSMADQIIRKVCASNLFEDKQEA